MMYNKIYLFLWRFFWRYFGGLSGSKASFLRDKVLKSVSAMGFRERSSFLRF